MSSKEFISFKRNLQIRHEVDVFIAGGGPAGIAAALAAAYNGCSVFLVEGQGCLGGMGTAGLIPVFMQFTDGINFLAGGVGEKIYKKLIENYGIEPYKGIGPGECAPIKPEILKRVYDDLLIDAGVEFSLMTQLVAVDMESRETVSSVILAAKSGIFAIKAKMYIDCTGDGDLSAWAGALFEKGDENGNLMAGTLCSLWTDIDWMKVAWERQDQYLEKAFNDRIFTVEDRHLPGIFKSGDHTGAGNMGHCFNLDGTDERSLTIAFVEQRKRLMEYEKYYKKYFPGFDKMELISTASLMGVRETRRITGDYKLGLDDFNKRAIFDDEIGRYAYCVDIHAANSGMAEYEKFLEEYEKLRYGIGESYGIPYRILTPSGLKNVLTAGRCVSSDRYIQSSIRVMPGCYITGQAAGAAASVAINGKTDTRGFDIGKLQQVIRKTGGFLPNFGK